MLKKNWFVMSQSDVLRQVCTGYESDGVVVQVLVRSRAASWRCASLQEQLVRLSYLVHRVLLTFNPAGRRRP